MQRGQGILKTCLTAVLGTADSGFGLVSMESYLTAIRLLSLFVGTWTPLFRFGLVLYSYGFGWRVRIRSLSRSSRIVQPLRLRDLGLPWAFEHGN